MSLLLGLFPKSLCFDRVWGGGQGFFSDWVVCVWGGGVCFLGLFHYGRGCLEGVVGIFCQFGL